jgi:hypothetical protein
MNSIHLPPEVIKMAGLLSSMSCSLSINLISGGVLVLSSQTDNEQHIFDLKIEYDQQRNIATFVVNTTESMDIGEYDRIFLLLNYLNVCDGERKFYLNPVTSLISCSSGLNVSRGALSSGLKDSLKLHLSTSMEDLTKLIRCITKKVSLREALEMTIGDTAEIMKTLR